MLPSAGLSLTTTHRNQHRKFQVYNAGSRYVVLISDMIIKYSRTMMVGT